MCVLLSQLETQLQCHLWANLNSEKCSMTSVHLLCREDRSVHRDRHKSNTNQNLSALMFLSSMYARRPTDACCWTDSCLGCVGFIGVKYIHDCVIYNQPKWVDKWNNVRVTVRLAVVIDTAGKDPGFRITVKCSEQKGTSSAAKVQQKKLWAKRGLSWSSQKKKVEYRPFFLGR